MTPPDPVPSRSYELKIADLAAETRRNTLLAAATRRLYDTLTAEFRVRGYSGSTVRDFYLSGFPEDERAALIAALRSQGVYADWMEAPDA